MLMLFVQVAMFFLHVPGVPAASLSPAEKLILGFEQAELGRGAHISRQEKPGRESWFYLLEQSDGYDFAARFEWPGETNRTWTWHCRRGEHTEGDLALVATVAPADQDKAAATYRRTEFLSFFYPNIRRGFVEARLLMTSFQWLVKARPDLRDWSDYDLLRVDVRSDAASVKLWLALEDNVLEPPVMRTYEIPADKWVTLELDLTKYTFTGVSWQAEHPVILDSDIRHCASNASVVRLRSGPFKGRIWASWGQIGREHAIDVHVKLSDDDGRTWIPWGKGAALPGSQSADWSDGTYSYPETAVCPYKDHVACFWRHKRGCGVRWSVFDGLGWSAPAEVSPVTLDDMDGAYRALGGRAPRISLPNLVLMNIDRLRASPSRPMPPRTLSRWSGATTMRVRLSS